MVLVVTRFENDEGLCQNWPSGARILTFMIIAKVCVFWCVMANLLGEGSLQFDSANKTNPDMVH